jgi:two-component system sensor histidine kinase RegB
MANSPLPSRLAGAPISPQAVVDRPPGDAAQVEAAAFDSATIRRGRLRVRTLVQLRWAVIGGQLLGLVVLGGLLGYPAPYAVCLTIVAAAAWLNLLTGVASAGQRLAGDWEAAGQLAFDVVQVAALMFMLGGVLNPFCIIAIAPITLAAATLPRRPLAAVCLVALAALVAVALIAQPLPWAVAAHPGPMPMLLASTALAAGALAIAGYARQAATEATRMELALNVTQAVLAREQRLSALGGLAAAAAHELGTPLATIAIVAKELARSAPTEAVKEDADLLIAQTARCREILKRLADTPAEATDELHERMSLLQFVHEAIEPLAETPGVRVEAIVAGAAGVEAPDIWRMPEVLHAFTSFIENAVDFARSEILVSARFDAGHVTVEVRDDGPGFAPEILAKLGEPYVTSRAGVEGGRTGHVGMGLGFFIAKTLLERTGAVVTFQNGRPSGAVVVARWPRARIEAKSA